MNSVLYRNQGIQNIIKRTVQIMLNRYLCAAIMTNYRLIVNERI